MPAHWSHSETCFSAAAVTSPNATCIGAEAHLTLNFLNIVPHSCPPFYTSLLVQKTKG